MGVRRGRRATAESSVELYPEQAALGCIRQHRVQDEAAKIFATFGFRPSKFIRVKGYDVLYADLLGVFRANAKRARKLPPVNWLIQMAVMDQKAPALCADGMLGTNRSPCSFAEIASSPGLS